jgi:hypothetical protein
VDVTDVTVGASVSQLLAPVAAALPDGAQVVAPDIEFSSNLFPWLVQEQRGVSVRTVPAEKLAEAVDAHTDLVAFSLVQSADGTVAAYEQVVAAARAHGALVAVDASCGGVLSRGRTGRLVPQTPGPMRALGRFCFEGLAGAAVDLRCGAIRDRRGGSDGCGAWMSRRPSLVKRPMPRKTIWTHVHPYSSPVPDLIRTCLLSR